LKFKSTLVNRNKLRTIIWRCIIEIRTISS